MPNTSATGGYLIPTSGPVQGDDLDDIFQALIAGVSGLPGKYVRPRWQPNPPKNPGVDVDWCAVGVTLDDPDANIALTHDPAANDGAGQDIAVRHQTLTVLASFYGPHASGLANQVRDALAIAQNREVLKTQLMTFVNSDTIRAVPELVNNQWLKRYDLPLTFRRKTVKTYAVENIVSASVSIEE